MDPITVALAAVLFSGGWLTGRYARLKRSPKQPMPVCMCDHHFGTHHPESVRSSFSTSTARTCGVGVHACATPARSPVEQYWVPPVADMSIVTAPRPEK